MPHSFHGRGADASVGRALNASRKRTVVHVRQTFCVARERMWVFVSFSALFLDEASTDR
jgi:hypothetical protein